MKLDRVVGLAGGACLMAAPGLVFAHVSGTSHEHGMSLGAAWGHGVLHPFSGLDHLLAMLALGVWISAAAFRERLAVIGAFLGSMVVGAGLGVAGLSLPAVEVVIALSVVALGLLVLAQRGWHLAAGLGAAAFFAFFHGFAHGTEIGAASAPAYFTGFLMGSAMLVSGGALMGVLVRERSAWALRPVGAAMACAGVGLLVGLI
ncbi:urease accessory protein UreJ [bacterium]|nr:urease accessory protein UreJ [bacterium]